MRMHKQQPSGFVALVTVLVISAIMLTLGLFTSAAAINEMMAGFSWDQAERALQITDACVDEAVFRLKSDSSYTGGTLSVNGGTCTSSVTGSGSTRTVTSTGTLGDFTKKISATATFVTNIAGTANTVDLTHWEEI